MKNGIHRLLIAALLIACAAMSACDARRKVSTQPAPATRPALTAEQKFALAKVGATGAAGGLAIRIASLERSPEKNAEKIRILKAAKGFIDEFNTQVEDVTTLDLSGREQVRRAIDKALAGANHLTATDVLQLNDPVAQADIRAAIDVLRSALKSFDVLFPAETPAGPTPQQQEKE